MRILCAAFMFCILVICIAILNKGGTHVGSEIPSDEMNLTRFPTAVQSISNGKELWLFVEIGWLTSRKGFTTAPPTIKLRERHILYFDTQWNRHSARSSFSDGLLFSPNTTTFARIDDTFMAFVGGPTSAPRHIFGLSTKGFAKLSDESRQAMEAKLGLTQGTVANTSIIESSMSSGWKHGYVSNHPFPYWPSTDNDDPDMTQAKGQTHGIHVRLYRAKPLGAKSFRLMAECRVGDHWKAIDIAGVDKDPVVAEKPIVEAMIEERIKSLE